MSEIAAAPSAPTVSAPVVDSGPSTTADIASSTIDRLESQAADANDIEVSGETPEPPADMPDTRREMLGDRLPDDAPAPVAPVTPPEGKKLTEAEQLLADAGYTFDKYPDGKPKMLPYHKVTKIIENALKDGKGQFGTQFQAVTQERDTYKANLDEMYSDLRGDPGVFLTKLAKADPRYFEALQSLANRAQAQVEPEPEPEMPQPDLPVGNGQWTYSKEGLERRDAWMQDKILRQVRQELAGELQPIKAREQQEQVRAQTREQLQQLAAQTQTVLQDAQTWPGFTEHEPAILKALQDDTAAARAAGQRPRLTLDAAYRQVVLPRLVENDTQKRARLLREANGAPKAPAIGRATADTPRRPGPVNTSDVAARVIARLERNGG